MRLEKLYPSPFGQVGGAQLSPREIDYPESVVFVTKTDTRGVIT